MDITQPIAFDDNTFDMIFCNQVLMDIKNIEFIFSKCSWLLKVVGIFYYTIVLLVIYDGITKNKEIPLFFVAEYRKIK